MPVILTGRDKHNVTDRHGLLFLIRSHDPLSRSDYQDLFIIMGMKFISDAFPEVDYDHLIFFAFTQNARMESRSRNGKPCPQGGAYWALAGREILRNSD